MQRFIPALMLVLATAASAAETPLPVIDMHLHALPADHQGPPPLAMCTPFPERPHWDPQEPYGPMFMRLMKQPACDDPIWSPDTDDGVLRRTLSEMRTHNVYGVLSGTPAMVATWRDAFPGRFMPGYGFALSQNTPSPAELLALHNEGALDVLAEITTQYAGIEPADERLEPYWAMLEQNDIPAGIHIGPGPPGVIYLGAKNYRARMHSALTLEEVLVRHPKLRVYVMHAGYPLLDDLLALLFAHPQVYVEVGVIVFTQPRGAFYRYLKGIVDAGFGNRVMFGSDQMVWPETIGRSIDIINAAPFLSEDQKRDILFNNAARFLRLSDDQVSAMHEGQPLP